MSKRIAVVTGAAKGIGLATSQALMAAGHVVVMLDRVPIDLKRLAVTDGQAVAFQADVTDLAMMTRLRAQIKERFGVVSILVNNAGISPKRPDGRSSGILELTVEE